MRAVISPDRGVYSYAGTSYADPDAVTQIANGLSTTTFTYDNNGNVTQKTVDGTTTTYVYDYANRLTALGVGGATTTYAYDWAGNRVSQTGTTTTYFYPFKWYSVASSTGSGAKYATTTDYVFNGDTLVATVDQQTASGSATGTGKTRYVHPDHLGSTNVVTDENGNVVQTVDYYSYGAIRISSATSTNERRKYVDQFTDDSGLNYLQARYQDLQRTQFISEDPVFQAIGDNNQVKQLAQRDQQTILSDPQQLNGYEYARDNPVTLSDPNGRILPIILGALAVYSAAQISIDAYDVYQTDYKYADVFSQEEKNQTNFKLAYDVSLAGVGAAAAVPRLGVEALGNALSVLTPASDALDTFFGKQIYKTYNDQLNRKKLVQTGANVSMSSISVSPSIPTYYHCCPVR